MLNAYNKVKIHGRYQITKKPTKKWQKKDDVNNPIEAESSD